MIDMDETKLTTLDQLRAFLAGTPEVEFNSALATDERYRHIATVLGRFQYARLKRPDKGVVLRYLMRTTAYSRQQLTRLVTQYLQTGRLSKHYAVPEKGFVRKFTQEDLVLLAQTDALHGTLSGPATRKIMERAVAVFGDTRYERLSSISVGHLYNLRKQAGYLDRRRHWTKTHGRSVPIGERRAPVPDGRPGFIRIDSVHQGGVFRASTPWFV